MFENYLNILDQMGFDTKCRGAVFFSSIISEVDALLEEGKSKSEVLVMLPSLYLEDYHFFFEVGRRKYFDEINNFMMSRDIKDKKSDKVITCSLDKFVFSFSDYCKSLNKNKDVHKEFKKI